MLKCWDPVARRAFTVDRRVTSVTLTDVEVTSSTGRLWVHSFPELEEHARHAKPPWARAVWAALRDEARELQQSGYRERRARGRLSRWRMTPELTSAIARLIARYEAGEDEVQNICVDGPAAGVVDLRPAGSKDVCGPDGQSGHYGRIGVLTERGSLSLHLQSENTGVPFATERSSKARAKGRSS